MTRGEVVTAARKFIGTPFLHQGRNRHGVDCAGFLALLFVGMGVPIKDFRAYGRTPYGEGLRTACRDNLGEPVTREWLPGDVALIAWEKHPHHVALIGEYAHGGLSLIHTYQSVGRVTEHRLDETWAARILEVYPCPVSR